MYTICSVLYSKYRLHMFASDPSDDNGNVCDSGAQTCVCEKENERDCAAVHEQNRSRANFILVGRNSFTLFGRQQS